MKGTLHPQVKVCCISSLQEADIAMHSGASALGLVGPMPSGPGIISNSLIREIKNYLPSSIDTFLLTSETSSLSIIEHQNKVQTSTIQIVDELKEGSYQELRNALPDVKLVQVIHVIDEASVREAIAIEKYVDVILLDSGNPKASVKELGGTGRIHNWEISRAIRETVNIPVFLAGGLHADNIQEAIRMVQPYGVDVCSGVRSNNKLDEKKLKAFFEALNSFSS